MAGCRRRGRRPRGCLDEAESPQARLEQANARVAADMAKAADGLVGMAEPQAHFGQFLPDLVGGQSTFDRAMQRCVALLRRLLGRGCMTLESHGFVLPGVEDLDTSGAPCIGAPRHALDRGVSAWMARRPGAGGVRSSRQCRVDVGGEEPPMRSIPSVRVAVCCLLAGALAAQNVTVPASLAGIEGGGGTNAPFGGSLPCRYQVIYDAEELPWSGPRVLTGPPPRADNNTLDTAMPAKGYLDISVLVSTTDVTLGTASAEFEENWAATRPGSSTTCRSSCRHSPRSARRRGRRTSRWCSRRRGSSASRRRRTGCRRLATC